MAHSASAKKRIRQNVKHRARNRWRKAKYRTAIKDYQEAILHAPIEECEKQLQGLYKILDKTASTPAMHKNTAARYKSRLAAKLNHKTAAASA